MTQLELLAPARDLACGLAAVDHGADAVYIGAPRFGARAAVGNSIDDIRQLCLYAHRFSVKVYVTVNTLIYDHELADTGQLVHQLQEAGVDAILVQDMGIVEMRKEKGEMWNGLSLHASTQTDNRTPEKVRWLRDLGFRRVVLARELSVQEIAEIHAAVPDVELEVFVHGALCVSYSGLCYASQHCFGRSANRGQCAQFCRMKFDLVDADGREWEHQRHLLSLKDLNQSQHLEELIEAGATSFKIEGRLKDASYVKNVVAAYSQRLDDIIRRYPDRYCRASEGHCTYTFTPSLKKTFNRGFTTYFLPCRRVANGDLQGRQPDIFSPDTPKAMGEFVGTVKELRRDSFNVAGTASFANGDGLCFINDDHELEGFRVNRAKGNRLFPYQMPRHLRAGMGLYRNFDQEFERQLSRPSASRKIALKMELEAFDDDGFASGYGLKLATDTASRWVRIHAPLEYARQSQRERIATELTKLGDTPYECRELVIPDDFPYFIPASRLAELRRLGISALQSQQPEKAPSDLLSPSVPSPQPPVDDVTRLYNVANRLACEFYGVSDVTAYELRPDHRPLMQCRHCLRYSLGYCVKHGGQRPEWREPLSLRLADGRMFRLEFDCKHCQMNVYSK